MSHNRENFGSLTTAIFAMAGSAIGLGNIWRFPYIVGEYGGAAFILIYILATMLVSLPIFVAEVTLGRRSRSSAYGSMQKLRPDDRRWKLAGIMSVLIPMVIVSYYSVVGGWSVDYLGKALASEFISEDPSTVSSLFGDFISNPWLPLVMQMLFLLTTLVIVALGVKSGIEKFSKYSIPVLFVLILVMCIYSISLPGAGQGVRYLLHPDFSQISPRSFAYALGQSFFSLSLGAGTIVTYGSYMRSRENIIQTSAGTAVSDLLFALLAGLAIMPAVFAAGIEPGAGPGLIFQTIPYIFSSMGASMPVVGTVISVVFFLTVVVAALTSSISLVEVGVAHLNEKYGLSRIKACIVVFVLCSSLGVLCSLSFGPLSSFTIFGKTIFDFCDWLISNMMMPLLALITTLFIGFALKRSEVRDEITNSGTVNGKVFPVFYFILKWVAPVFIIVIMVTNFIL